MARQNNAPKRTATHDDDLLSLRNIRTGFAKKLQAVSLVFVFVIAASLITYFAAVPTGGPPGGGRASEIVAEVNGEPIQRDLFEETVQDRARERAMLSGDALASIGARAEVFREQVDQVLIAQAAGKEGIRLSDRDLDREIDKLVDQQVKQERERAAQGKQLTDQQFEMIIRNAMGKSVAEWREELKQNWETRKPLLRQALLQQKLMEKVANVPNPSDEELKRSYDLLTIRHILISTGNRTEEQARKRAEEILQKVRAGGDFAKLAKEFSDDPGSKQNGGSLGAIPRSQVATLFVPEFAKAVETLQPGQISDLVKTQFGFHIIRLDAVKPNVPADFDKKKAEYAKQYVDTMRNAKWQQYLMQLRRTAKIEVLDPELKAFQALEEWQKQAGKPEYAAGIARVIEAFEKATQEMPSADAMVVLGMLYQQQSEMPGLAESARKKARENAITAWQNALQRMESVQLRFMLADLYRKEKQNDLAIKQYQEISQIAWDRPDIHAQLKNIYKQMGRQDLVQKEMEWEKKYQERMKTERVPPPSSAQPAPARKP
ncbi:MAG: peptidylprolyl isomerase [Armatimonadota bacterium]|nr:peptidylprolyl isomerase [bacterium]MDW8320726.1 peptidylprolyl isomerase [Armatimonadota bacterium]